MMLNLQQKMTRLGQHIALLFIWAIALCVVATLVALTTKFILWLF